MSEERDTKTIAGKFTEVLGGPPNHKEEMMITVGELRKRLGAYPSEAPVFLVTMRRDMRADIEDGGIVVRSSIQPWLVYDKDHAPAGRVTLWEHVALEEMK